MYMHPYYNIYVHIFNIYLICTCMYCGYVCVEYRTIYMYYPGGFDRRKYPLPLPSMSQANLSGARTTLQSHSMGYGNAHSHALLCVHLFDSVTLIFYPVFVEHSLYAQVCLPTVPLPTPPSSSQPQPSHNLPHDRRKTETHR